MGNPRIVNNRGTDGELARASTSDSAGFPHLKETHENSLNFAISLKDLEIHWNFIKYINILKTP